MAMYAGSHHNGSILESPNGFTFDADTNQVTTTVINQVFTLKNAGTVQARSFTFKPRSGTINFDLNLLSIHRLKIEQNELRGIDNSMFLTSFIAHAALGAIFEFDCIV